MKRKKDTLATDDEDTVGWMLIGMLIGRPEDVKELAHKVEREA